MSTILFNHIVFGPIISRRLGHSLGVNLLPKFGKWCSFDCIYCECGWNKDGKDDRKLPSKEEVFQALESKLLELQASGTPVDTITFSGNGEPTLHPDFAQIIDFTIAVRDKYFPKAKVSVLTNATQIGRKEVRGALLKVDNAILKIDSPIEQMAHAIDNPSNGYSLAQVIENMKKFNGNFILQTMFLKGWDRSGKFYIDCTNEEHCAAWRELVREIRPREIMMYTIDRETPQSGLEKVSEEQMKMIAAELVSEGFEVQIKG